MNNKFCALSVKERSQRNSCGCIYSLFSEQTWADFQAHDTGSHSFLRSLFILNGKGKAADKVPSTNTEETDGAQGWLCSFIYIFSISLPAEMWFFCLSRSGYVPKVTGELTGWRAGLRDLAFHCRIQAIQWAWVPQIFQCHSVWGIVLQPSWASGAKVTENILKNFKSTF